MARRSEKEKSIVKAGDIVRLTKISANPNLVRTPYVDGIMSGVPTINRQFILHGESLEFLGGVRQISTSHVKKIEIENGVWTLFTENSVYELAKLT